MSGAPLNDDVRAEIKRALTCEGFYIITDENAHGVETPVLSEGGKLYCFTFDKELDPEKFFGTARFWGPIRISDPKNNYGPQSREGWYKLAVGCASDCSEALHQNMNRQGIDALTDRQRSLVDNAIFSAICAAYSSVIEEVRLGNDVSGARIYPDEAACFFVKNRKKNNE